MSVLPANELAVVTTAVSPVEEASKKKKKEFEIVHREGSAAPLILYDYEYLNKLAEHQNLARDYLPRIFAFDATLTELRLSGTHCGDLALTALADGLTYNTALKELYLDKNGITDEGAVLLAEALLKNSVLRVLTLEDNFIGARGAKALCDALEVNNDLSTLSLKYNEDVPDATHELLHVLTTLNARPPALKRVILRLRSNSFSEDTIQLAFDRIHPPSVHKTHRDLTHDDKIFLDDWCADLLAENLKSNATVTTVDLSGHHIGDRGAAALANMLRVNRTVDRLVLQGNVITAAGAQEFIEALEDNNSIRAINLMNNAVTNEMIVQVGWALALNRQPMTLKALVPRMKANDPTLTAIDLDDHESQRSYDDVACRIVAESLRRNTFVRSVSITRGKITGVGLRFLCDLLGFNECITSIDLSHNPLGGTSIFLAKALLTSRSVYSVKLSDTGMTDEAAKAFANVLVHTTTLEELDLSENPNIRASGQDISRALSFNTSINSLLLTGSSIQERVMEEIRERLRLAAEPMVLRSTLPRIFSGDVRLTTIDLCGKGSPHVLRDSAMSLLGEALSKNFVVTSLDISWNAITFVGFTSIALALSENRVTLRRLNLSHNPIGNGFEFGRLIADMLKGHNCLRELNIEATGLNDQGCECIFRAINDDKVLPLRVLNIEQNPEVSKQTRFKTDMICECSSLLFSFRERVRILWRQWEGNDERGLYTDDSLKFSNYDAGSPTDETQSINSDVYMNAATVICNIVRNTKGYHKVYFAKNKLDDHGAAEFAALLEDAPVTVLDLSDNQMTDNGVDMLIRAAKHSYTILEIKLEGNAALSEEKKELLRTIVLFNQQPKFIKDILVRISTDPTFTEIDFSAQQTNHIVDDQVLLLCDALEDNTTITTVNLSNNHIKLRGFKRLMKFLCKNKSVKKFVLRNTLVKGAEVGPALASAIKETKTLTFIDISYNELCDEVVPPLLEAISANRSLQVLGLNESGISDKLVFDVRNALSLNSHTGLKDLVPQLKASTDHITTISAAAAQYTDGNAIEIFSALRSNNRVTEVDLSDNNLSDACGAELFRLLAFNSSVITLNLSCNRFGPETVASVVDMAKKNATLQRLQLCSNPFIKQDAAEQLERQILDVNNTIWEIDLRQCAEVSKETCAFLLSALSLNRQLGIKSALPRLERNDPTLLELDASKEPEHDDSGCLRLSRVLIHNDCLISLNLSHGLITDIGVDALCYGLRSNRRLTTLNLAYNKFGDIGATAIADLLKVNNVIMSIDISGNQCVTATGVDRLRNVLVINDAVKSLEAQDLGAAVDREVQRHMQFVKDLNSRHPNLKKFLRTYQDCVIQTLDCSNSRAQGAIFDNMACEALCNVLKDNVFLTKVDISHNDLTFEAGDMISSMLLVNTSLTTMNVSHNNLSDGCITIIDSLTKNHTVIAMDLSNNSCSPLALERLSIFLALNREPMVMKTEALKIMQFDCTCKATSINTEVIDSTGLGQRKPQLDNDSVDLLASILRTNTIVREINLDWNAITDSGFHALLLLAKRNPTITSISFAHNMITDDGVHILKEALPGIHALSHVNLAHNALTAASVPELSEILRVHPRIEQILINGNRIPSSALDTVEFLSSLNKHASDSVRDILRRVQQNDPTITELIFDSFYSMGNWLINGITLSQLTFALKANTKVVKLSLEFNDIDDRSIERLCHLVTQNKTLKILNLANNLIQNVAAFFVAMKSNSSIRTLDLRHNKLNLDGARVIAAYLKDCDNLEELDISQNHFGRSGAVIIQSALAMNEGLRTIYIEGKGIDTALAEAVQHATTLSYRKVQLKEN